GFAGDPEGPCRSSPGSPVLPGRKSASQGHLRLAVAGHRQRKRHFLLVGQLEAKAVEDRQCQADQRRGVVQVQPQVLEVGPCCLLQLRRKQSKEILQRGRWLALANEEG